MGACVATFKGDPDGEIVWYPAHSDASVRWQNRQTGFGYKKDRSFRQRAVRHDGYNRQGNEDGELGGKILVYQNIEDDANYSNVPEASNFMFKDGDKLFAKVFLSLPMGMTPIGQNNIITSKEPRAEGATLLGSRPRVIAIYLDVDGKPQCNEHFCKTSKSYFDSEMELLNLDPKPKDVEKAMPGSFFTFTSSSELESYSFIHLPLVGTLSDISFKSGLYAESLVRAFCGLLAKLSPGHHKFDMKVQYWYDHCDYNVFVLGDGTNVLGRWYRNISNAQLKSPHESPELLVSPDDPLAVGTFSLDLVCPFQKTILRYMDRKPPPDKYRRGDSEDIRKIAQTVAAGRFCEEFGLCGLPDWVVLTSPIKTRIVTTNETLAGKHKYEALDYAALWFNEADGRRPDATGTMVEGSMARGEITLGRITVDWVWAPSIRDGQVIPTRRRPIKNKYIAEAEKDSRKGPRLSDWQKLRELYNLHNDEEEEEKGAEEEKKV